MKTKTIKKKASVSAVIGVILMVAITIAIAVTVYMYVSNMIDNDSDVEQDITDLLNEKITFSDGYQIYQVTYEKTFYLYEVNVMLVNGDEPIRDIFDIIVNLETDKIYFSYFNDYFELKE